MTTANEAPTLPEAPPGRSAPRRERRPGTSLYRMLAIAGIVTLPFCLTNLLRPDLVNWIWYARFVDIVVIFVIVLAATLAVQIARSNRSERDFTKSLEFAVATSMVLLGTLFVTYASFRNQTRLTAEIGLNDEAMQLYGLETAHPELRCLYENYGHYNPERCLANIVSNADTWSLGIFYVEEAWFVLEIARVDERQWGSTYSDSVEFWRDDVEKDPTGLFSYYLVASEEGFGEAQKAMRKAGVEIKQLCKNYRKVWVHLRRASANPGLLVPCVPED